MSLLRPRILVIDDEPQIHRFLTPALTAGGYEPLRADTAEQALREIARQAPDALLLDLGLPDMDGQNLLVKARCFYTGPILVLSARDREAEKIQALDSGADDYIDKPFGIGELLARLRVALRREMQHEASPPVVRSGDLEIDIGNRMVRRNGSRVRLSPKEFELLGRLVADAGRVLTHRQLLTAVWGPAHANDTQYLRVFVGQLRQKLEAEPAAPLHIVTEPGVGYRFITS
ncbi:MAG: winged helix-turn-helix domain-containing protein [Caulobacterales bacterium]|nr:winged helix-turn-helix domain-containing protein [Caulobacterales bacterium]